MSERDPSSRRSRRRSGPTSATNFDDDGVNEIEDEGEFRGFTKLEAGILGGVILLGGAVIFLGGSYFAPNEQVVLLDRVTDGFQLIREQPVTAVVVFLIFSAVAGLLFR